MFKKQMLIVDDNRGLREALRAVFEDQYDLEFAESGEAAIKTTYQHQPEIVLMDYRMPGLNGIETMEMLRKLSPFSQMVIMSAYDDREMVANCFRGGACDFVGKPFELHEIREVVEQAARKIKKTKIFQSARKTKNNVITQPEIDSLIDETLRVACL